MRFGIFNYFRCIKNKGWTQGNDLWSLFGYYEQYPERIPTLIKSIRKFDTVWADKISNKYQKWLAKNNI